MTVSRWHRAAYLPSLAPGLGEALGKARGATHVEVAASGERVAEDLEALADAGVIVACAALGHGLPAGHSLAAADVHVRRATLRLLKEQVSDAARLGAVCVALEGFPSGEEAQARFAEGAVLLADQAASRMVRLSVGGENPERVMDWLATANHPALGLLLIVRPGVNVNGFARRAGGWLFHVRVEGAMGDLGAVLDEIGYREVVSFAGERV